MWISRTINSSGLFVFSLLLRLLHSRIANEDSVLVIHAEAVAGGIAKLPCDMTPPVDEDRVHLVIWYKESGDMPIYSFDARGMSIETAKHWSDNSILGGRAYFRFTNGPATLTLESVKASDNGNYRCRVDFRKSPTRNSKVNLTVILPPERLTVLNERGEHIQHYILGPYNEGASISITCISFGGRPLPKITWWQENTLLDDTFEILSESRVRNILHLERLERRHLNTVYTCQATNNNHISPISNAVTLDMNLRPLWVRILGDNRPLSADKTYEISCEAVGARPPPYISWWKGSTSMRNARELTTSDGNTTVSTLTIVPQIQDTGKFLSCRVSTQLTGSSPLEDGWKLNIYHVPVMTLDLGRNINSSDIKEGVDVYFECNIKSNPWVYKVTWKHNGNTINNNATAGTIVSNQSLVLQAVTRERGGTYKCVASNPEGDGESNSINLDIKFAPVCQQGQQKVIGVAKHEAARISCEVDANPKDVHFTWKFNNSGESMEIPSSHYTIDRTKSLASYTPFTEQDYGSLLCWARNEFGEQKLPCVFHVVPAGKPEVMGNCTVTNQTTSAVYIECEPGFDGGLLQDFIMEAYGDDNTMLLTNVTSRVPWFIISGLAEGTFLNIYLYSVNSKGRSERIYIRSQTLKSAQRHTGVTPVMFELPPFVCIALGALLLILLVLAALVIFRFRRRNLKRKPHDNSRKPSDGSTDSLEKNPDIIPLSGEHQVMVQDKSVLENQAIPSHNTYSLPRRKPKFPETSLGGSVLTHCVRSNINPNIAACTPEDVFGQCAYPTGMSSQQQEIIVQPMVLLTEYDHHDNSQIITATRF